MIQLSIPGGIERRQHQRVTREVTVKYRLPRSDEWLVGESADLSVGGLFISAKEPPRVGTKLVCELFFDGTNLMKGTGIVRSQRSGDTPGFGIQFDDLDAAAHARILGLVESYVTGESAKVPMPALGVATAPSRRRGAPAWLWALVPVAVAGAGLVWWLLGRR